MTKEDILKHQITAQYKNVSTFCEKTGIQESTVRNIFKRGFDGVGVRTAIKICHALSLDIDLADVMGALAGVCYSTFEIIDD